MFVKLSLLSIVTAVAPLVLSPAHAEPPSGPNWRAEVKAETRAAQRAGELTPAGEGVRREPPTAPSTKTRSERKAEALQARKAGEFRKAGLEPEWKEQRAAARVPSTTSRAGRKQSTLAAARAGQLTPAGEAVSPRKQQ